MAIEFSTIVWQMSPYKAEKLLAHLAFADWANQTGEFHPIPSEVAQKARLTERGAEKIIAQMLEDGEIELLEKGGGRGRRNRYRFAEHYRQAVERLAQNWAAKRARKAGRNTEPETVFKEANTERDSVNMKAETPNDIRGMRTQTPNEEAENTERESSAYKELSPSCIPSIKNPLRGESFPSPVSEEDLEELAKAIQKVTGFRSSGWISEGQIRTAAIELHGQGFSADDVLSVSKRIGDKVYKLRFIAQDLVTDRAQLANGGRNGKRGTTGPAKSESADSGVTSRFKGAREL